MDINIKLMDKVFNDVEGSYDSLLYNVKYIILDSLAGVKIQVGAFFGKIAALKRAQSRLAEPDVDGEEGIVSFVF